MLDVQHPGYATVLLQDYFVLFIIMCITPYGMWTCLSADSLMLLCSAHAY
jgi:hypothetical protein